MGKASLVVCVSQAPYLFDESVHVLKFASIASRVTVQQFKGISYTFCILAKFILVFFILYTLIVYRVPIF